MPEELNVQKPAPTTEPGRPLVAAVPAGPQPPNKKILARLILIGISMMVALAVAVYFFGPRRQEAAGGRGSYGKAKNVPVTVAIAKAEVVPIQVRTTGNILAYSTVNIVPQVSGQIVKVCFTQGQTVKKGDLLFLIDPRPYQASLNQALGTVQKDLANIKSAEANMARDQALVGQLQANLTKDQASQRYADVEAKRYKSLVAQGAISQEQADQTLTNYATALAQIEADKKQIENELAVVNSDKAQIDTAKATLSADQAVAENAKIQLNWCTIRAPIDGRTGSLQVYEGNVVAANNPAPLVTIAQVQPIYVQFTVPEEYLDQVRRCLADGTLRIQALIEGVATDAVTGTASFLDNTVNTTSGTALLRASFANADSRLYPGQFVDVMVTMPPPGPSIVVPISAIQTTQKGNAVYIVNPDNTVQLVPVDLARSSDEWAAINSGIKAGDKVVTDGQLQLIPGASVNIVSPDGSGGANSGGHGRHRHGSGKSPDAGYNAGGSDNAAAPFNPLPTGNSSQSGSGWGSGQTQGWGSRMSGTPASLPVGDNPPGAAPAAPTPGSPFNPATNGGAPFRAAPPVPSSLGAGGFVALPGASASRSAHSGGGGWRHRQ